MSLHKTRIMYIERKEESLSGPARIGRVTFSKSGRSVSYRGQTFLKSKRGYKWNRIDVETGAVKPGSHPVRNALPTAATTSGWR